MGRAMESVKAHHTEIREKVEAYTGRLLDLKRYMVRCESQGLGVWFLDVDRAMDIKVVREYVGFLQEELLPHVLGEERALYPRVDKLLGDGGMVTRGMLMEHRAIHSQIDTLVKQASLEKHDFEEVLQAVIELRAVLLLHLDKEEQILLPLIEERLSDEEQERLLKEMHEG